LPAGGGGPAAIPANHDGWRWAAETDAAVQATPTSKRRNSPLAEARGEGGDRGIVVLVINRMLFEAETAW
jgi:hypothetical protein